MDDARKAQQMVKADLGNPHACFEVGMMYYEGTDGVVQDYKQAGKFLLVSANDGYEIAHYFLGVMYQKGQGVPQHYVRAHMWMNLASRLGDNDWVSIREEIEKLLTPEQIERAQDMAVKWLEDNPEVAI